MASLFKKLTDEGKSSWKSPLIPFLSRGAHCDFNVYLLNDFPSYLHTQVYSQKNYGTILGEYTEDCFNINDISLCV